MTGGGPPARPLLLATAVAAATVSLAACGDAGDGAAGSADPPAGEPAVWTVAAEPLLEIGVVEGEEPYQLHRAGSSVRLPDGRIVVANTGSSELRFFDADGTFLGAQGSRGEGPGEWQTIARVRLRGPDTLLVIDTGQRRNGLVSTAGEYLGALPWRSEELFPSDQFLHGRFIVDAPLPPEDRALVTGALDRSAEPDTGRVAFARAVPTGHVWVTDDVRAGDAGRAWRVYDLDGRRIASIRTPAGLAVHDVGPDWVLGVVRDELDVQHLRLHRIEGTRDADRDALARAAAASDAGASTFEVWPSDSFPDIMRLVRGMAVAQEMHYADHYRYTTSVDTLASNIPDVPEDVRFEPIVGDDRGWTWRVVEEGSGRGCILSYGAGAVMGLTSGMPVCFGPPGGGGAAG